MNTAKNPFQIVGYSKEEFFCDREKETQLLTSAIKNGRNLNIFNIRRIGKTALIQHVLRKLPNTYVPIFIDISQTESQSDLAKLLIENLVREIDRLDKNLLRKLTSWVSSLGASLSIDPNTGSLEIGVKSNMRLAESTIFDAFAFTKKFSNKTFVIAIDEFQQILSYPEKKCRSTV